MKMSIEINTAQYLLPKRESLPTWYRSMYAFSHSAEVGGRRTESAQSPTMISSFNSLSAIGVFIRLSKLPLSASGVFIRLPRFRELTEAGQTLLI